MTSTRQQKVARLIQKELGYYFQKESRNQFHGTLISVTVVRMSADLAIAKVYVSLFPPQKKEETLQLIRSHTKTIRHELAQRIKNQMRAVPDLIFFEDDSLDYAENIDNLLKS